MNGSLIQSIMHGEKGNFMETINWDTFIGTDHIDCYYKVRSRNGVVNVDYESYNDAFEVALKLRDEGDMFVYIYRCSIINHLAPLENNNGKR